MIALGKGSENVAAFADRLQFGPRKKIMLIILGKED